MCYDPEVYCPECDDVLYDHDYCEDCDRKWTQEELNQHVEKESDAYVNWMKEQHPEWFEGGTSE